VRRLVLITRPAVIRLVNQVHESRAILPKHGVNLMMPETGLWHTN
jgi:hypothetical protein